MLAALERWKPAATARTHTLAAALLWTLVGGGLCAAGIRWCVQSDRQPMVLLLAGASLGALKGRVALARTALRSAARIARRGDGKCIGGFLSWQSWLFVVVMMSLGGTLRHSDVARWILGVVYTAVGVALLWGSQIYWAAWRRLP